MREKLEKIVSKYGDDPQIDMAIEEMSELAKALLKFRRARKKGEASKEIYDAIVDEIADVRIMAEQLEIIFGCSEAVEKRMEYKVNRQMKRLEAGK